MKSLTVIFEKPKKMPKIAVFSHFEILWSINANFAKHPVCGKMLGIKSSFTSRSMRWSCWAHSGPSQDFTNSPQLVHDPRPTIHFLTKENLWYELKHSCCQPCGHGKGYLTSQLSKVNVLTWKRYEEYSA